MPLVTTLRSEPSDRKKHKKRKADKGDKDERSKVGQAVFDSLIAWMFG